MTSHTITRWWLSAVECSLSSASVAVFTAVRNPKVISEPTMSLSMVFGTPMMLTPASTSGAAAAMVPSPPITMMASSACRRAVSTHRPMTSSKTGPVTGSTRTQYLRGLQRLFEPRMVPPRVRMPLTSRVLSGRTRSSMRPWKPSSMPTTSMPYFQMAVFVTARMTALSPGQSPPPVRTPIRLMLCGMGGSG